VPELSRFHGVVIGMYYREHGLPHFPARTGEFRLVVEIETDIVRGAFPAASIRLVLDWATRHKAGLPDNWHRARLRQPLRPIAPQE
jgi:hypothetical protein